MRNLQLPGRSPVRTTRAMAATSQPLATEAAVKILRDGGNAIDAAIAAVSVQCVVEPQSTGVGGDCFALIAKGGSADVIAFNGSGKAPAAASVEALNALGVTELERTSAHSVTIPGAVDAWSQMLADHGTMSMAQVLESAIYYAENGYVVPDRIAFDWSHEKDVLASDPAKNGAVQRLFLMDGKTPKAGTIHKQPELAETLRAIAEHGRDGFYKGAVAEDMVSTLNAIGGLHTLEDFASYAGDYVTPISAEYNGVTVHECPPNGQGIIALMILNIFTALKNKGVGIGTGPRSADRLHIEAEAARLAYAARDRHLADPTMADVPSDWLLSTELAEKLADTIDMNAAMGDVSDFDQVAQRDTVYLSIVDKDRNAVSLINSTFFSFGSGIVTPNTGVVLHNRGMSFSMKADHPNRIDGGKRPMHTIIPGMVTQDDKVVAPFGVMGGHYQALGHAHLLSSILDFGMDPQEAIEAPRVMFADGMDLDIEDGTGQSVRDGLAAKGHRLVRSEKPIGGAQCIWIDHEAGTLTGGSETRKDGMAAGF